MQHLRADVLRSVCTFMSTVLTLGTQCEHMAGSTNVRTPSPTTTTNEL